jgi:tetrapyrrole methylase family protein/MazG family protein
MSGRVVIVGLGPAGADHVLPAARTALERAPRRFARTSRHPAIAELTAAGLAFESFDAHYEHAPDLEAAYTAMVHDLVGSAANGADVAYAVPGNPAVAERTVALLHAAAARGEVDLSVVAGLSFADLAWSRVGIDPMETGARVVDARAIDDADLAGPVLIAQCDSALVLSDVKLVLLEHLDPTTPVTVLQRLGLENERVSEVELVELDRVVDPDHLTSLFVRVGAGEARAGRELARLLLLAKRLRDPGGCPWDAQQTHHSLTRYLVEEAYEVVEAIEALPLDAPSPSTPAAAYAALADELGDLLYQVVFHCVLAQEVGAFTTADVARGIHDKLVRRHPHVFGDVVADEAADVVRNWEQIKRKEKGSASIVDGITPGLPSLVYVNKLFSKAASVGLHPGTRDEAIERMELALTGLRAGDIDVETALARLLAAAVVLARARGVDAESALRGWSARYRDHFMAMERLAAARGLDLATLDPPAVAALWLEA